MSEQNSVSVPSTAAAVASTVARPASSSSRRDFLKSSSLLVAGGAVAGTVAEVTVNGQKLDPERSYKVATIDFLLGGGDGYSILAKGKPLIDAENGQLTSAQLMAYIAKLKTIDIAPDGRIEARK